jgi:hypothetical protein
VLHNLVGGATRQGGDGAKPRGEGLARLLHRVNAMSGANESERDEGDDDLFGGWFEEGDLAMVPEAAPYEEVRDRRARVGVVVAAVSATALALLIVFAGRV